MNTPMRLPFRPGSAITALRSRGPGAGAQAAQRGFTLVELLVVVALIAILAGTVVALMGGATDKSAAMVSMATQKQLMNDFGAYSALHNQTLPDNFDSLVRNDSATQAPTYTNVGTIPIADDLTKVIAQPVTPTSSTLPQNVNRGVPLEAYIGDNRVLTATKLSASDVTTLSSLGITAVYDTNTADAFHGNLGYTKRALAADQPICIVDPQSVAGQVLYKDLGTDLSDDTKYAKDGTTKELTAAGRQAALTMQVYWVVALGPNSSMIGDQLAGVQEAPVSSVVSAGFYNRFMVVIKKNMGPTNQVPALAGVLDPRGRGPTAARAAVNSMR